RLGPRVLVCETAAPGTEMLLGIVRDPALGPLIVAGAGGVLTERLAARVVARPPVDRGGARRMRRRLRVSVLVGALRAPPHARPGAPGQRPGGPAAAAMAAAVSAVGAVPGRPAGNEIEASTP